MDEQGYRFGVGVLVVASIVIAVILILFFGAAPNFFAERYNVTIRFDAAPGVATDTPVRKNGVQIGRVKSVQLLKREGVDLTLELDAEHEIQAGELPRIAVGSIITGDAVVEFLSNPPAESLLARFDGTGGSPRDGVLDANEMQLASAIIKDGDFYQGGRVAPDPLDALMNMQEGMGTTLASIQAASNQVNALALDIRKIVSSSDGELNRIAEQAELTIRNFNNTLNSIESLFSDPNLRSTLQTVADRLPALADEAQLVMKQTENTLAAFEDVGRAAEETVKNVTQTVRNVNELTEPLSRNGDRIVSDTMRTLNNLDALLVDLRQVAARINNSQGTVGKLLEDDQLYYTFINTLQNVETLTRKIQPVVDDVRVISDKVARNPSSLIDLRGAITGRPTAAGIK